MRSIFLLSLFLSAATITFGQRATIPLGLGVKDPMTQKYKPDWSDRLSINDANGQPIIDRYPGVDGSPFFNDAYKLSDIILNNGRAFKNVKSRIDLVTQEVHFISANGVAAFMQRGTVKEVTYSDTTEAGIIQYKFQTGFPSVSDKSKEEFYLVLAEGPQTFLKSISKKVTEKKNDLTNEVIKEFETYENYFFYTKGEMKRWKKDKEAVLAEMMDKKVQVDQFVIANKINFKNAESVVKLLNYYNSL